MFTTIKNVANAAKAAWAHAEQQVQQEKTFQQVGENRLKYALMTEKQKDALKMQIWSLSQLETHINGASADEDYWSEEEWDYYYVRQDYHRVINGMPTIEEEYGNR